MTVAAVSLKSS